MKDLPFKTTRDELLHVLPIVFAIMNNLSVDFSKTLMQHLTAASTWVLCMLRAFMNFM